MASPKITTTQFVPCTLSFVRANGSTAEIDGVPIIEVLTPEFISISNVSPDGRSFNVEAGAAGVGAFKVTVDADTSEGVFEVSAVAEVVVTEDLNLIINFTFGEPTPKQ